MTLDDAIGFVEWIELNEPYSMLVAMPFEYLDKAKEAMKTIYDAYVEGESVPFYAYGFLYFIVMKIENSIRYRETNKHYRKGFDYSRFFIKIGRRDGFKCKNCGGDKDLEIDHIIPVSKGGTNDLKNLQLLCLKCNRQKGIK